MPVNAKVKKGETRLQYRERILREMKKERLWHRRKLSSGEIPVVMDVDDFGFLLPGHEDLLRLKKSFPNFKITCFTIPLSSAFFHSENSKQFAVDKYRKWAEMVNKEDWIEIAIHGFSHVHNEMESSYEKTTELLTATENLFKEVGLKYSKIFKAPFWQYSYDALVALRDKGYVVAIDRNHPRPVPPGLKTYTYDWSFEEPLPEVKKLEDKKLFAPIKGHGHFTGRNKNNIDDCLANILGELPKDTKFMTIGEYMEKYEN